MPHDTLEDIALRSTNPAQRAFDVFRVIIVQLLMLIIAAAERNPDKFRNHPSFGPNGILARFDAGETFDLPPLMIASMRASICVIRGMLLHHDANAARSGAAIEATRQNSATRCMAVRRGDRARHNAQTAHRAATYARQVTRSLRHAAVAGLIERIAVCLQGLLAFNSLQYRNECVSARA